MDVGPQINVGHGVAVVRDGATTQIKVPVIVQEIVIRSMIVLDHVLITTLVYICFIMIKLVKINLLRMLIIRIIMDAERMGNAGHGATVGMVGAIHRRLFLYSCRRLQFTC
jgi:hypothetical protein